MGICKVGEGHFGVSSRAIYRAKSLKKNEFTGEYSYVYGAYFKTEKANYCFAEEAPDDNIVHYMVCTRQGDWNMKNEIELIPIDGDTVRQSTGCYDRTGKMIFEGDELLIGEKYHTVVYDTQKARFILQLYLPEENRVTSIDFDSTFVRQYKCIEEKL